MIADIETTETAIKYKGYTIYTSRNFAIIDGKDFERYLSLVIQNPTHSTVATFDKLSMRLIHTRKGNGIVDVDADIPTSIDITSYGKYSLITDRLDIATNKQKIIRHHVTQYPIMNAIIQDNKIIVIITKHTYHVLGKDNNFSYATNGENIQSLYFEIIENNLYIRDIAQ